MSKDEVRKGLDGVKADYTAVSTVGKHEAGLTYRGFAIEDLAASFLSAPIHDSEIEFQST